MDKIVNYIQMHWLEISGAAGWLGWAISEIMAINPNCKSKGVLKFILAFLKKINPSVNVNNPPNPDPINTIKAVPLSNNNIPEVK